MKTLTQIGIDAGTKAAKDGALRMVVLMTMGDVICRAAAKRRSSDEEVKQACLDSRAAVLKAFPHI